MLDMIQSAAAAMIAAVGSWSWELCLGVLVLLAFGFALGAVMASSTGNEVLRLVFGFLCAACGVGFVAICLCAVGLPLWKWSVRLLGGGLGSGWLS
jgi:uncharacterized membrane protein YfcA